MSSDKNMILIVTNCKGSELASASSEHIEKVRSKGVLLKNVKSSGDYKTLALTAGTKESILDATKAANLVVGSLEEAFDICYIDNVNSTADLEKELFTALEKVDRKTLLVIISDTAVIYYGVGIAKGVVIDTEESICSVAPTCAYIVNLPMPSECSASITFSVLKDINMKFKYEKKLQESIANMEAAIDRKTRQPWDKHDCA